MSYVSQPEVLRSLTPARKKVSRYVTRVQRHDADLVTHWCIPAHVNDLQEQGSVSVREKQCRRARKLALPEQIHLTIESDRVFEEQQR